MIVLSCTLVQLDLVATIRTFIFIAICIWYYGNITLKTIIKPDGQRIIDELVDEWYGRQQLLS